MNQLHRLSDADPELWALVEAYCDRRATTSQRDALDARLAADPEARRFYLGYLQLHADLAWNHRGTADSAPAVEERSTPVLGFLGRTTALLSRPVFWSICGVGVLFAGYVVLVSWNMLSLEAVDRRPKAVAGGSGSDLQPSASGLHSDAFATITASQDAEWSPHVGKSLRDLHSASQRDATTRAEIPPGEPLAITSGLVELKLKQGTTLLLEGPAQWSIDGENQATLKRGKLVAKVPQQAIGFTLETPTATIVDLGTEFGVEVKESGESGVQVVRGKVEVQQQGKPGSKLSEGESVHISRAGIKPTQQDLSSFSALLERGGNGPAPAAMPDVDLVFSMGVDFHEGWSAAKAWGGEAPKPGKRYHVGHTTEQTLRSPFSARPQPFLGSELVLHARGGIGLKHAGDTKLELLTLDGGLLNSVKQPEVGGPETGISGKIRVQQDSRMGVGSPLTISSRLEGKANLTVVGPGRLTLSGDGRDYSGNWQIQNAQLVALTLNSLGSGNVSLEDKGMLDLRYRWNNPQARLSVAQGSSLSLGFSATLGELLVDGKPVAAGPHTLKELKDKYPGYFVGSDDSLTVEIKGLREAATP